MTLMKMVIYDHVWPRLETVLVKSSWVRLLFILMIVLRTMGWSYDNLSDSNYDDNQKSWGPRNNQLDIS